MVIEILIIKNDTFYKGAYWLRYFFQFVMCFNNLRQIKKTNQMNFRFATIILNRQRR